MRPVFSVLIIMLIYGISISLVIRTAEGGSGDRVEESIMSSKQGSQTDAGSIKREEEAISLDGLSVAQMKELREKSEKHTFQAEVDRMMKLIINSLYKNKEIFLRELISNASDALDKIRFLALTDDTALKATSEQKIWIKADKDTKTIRVIDTGIGMTKQDMVNNLGTIAKSGTSDFIKRLSDKKSSGEMSDLIGQFGVGFYSSFLVADRVTVVSKHNDDEQHIWESDASSFSITKDPRGDTLKRGTEIILHLKEEAQDYLDQSTIKTLVSKYSQFINFPISLWASSTEMVEEQPEKAADSDTKNEKKDEEKKEDDATVEEEKDKEKKAEPKKVEKTIWDWEQVNKNKPIWTRKPAEVKDEQYNEFYKSFAHESDNPLGKIHFKAEGEVTFTSILFIPKTAPYDIYSAPNKKSDNIKMYVRRVFITDDFSDMMPKYLNFIKGVVDSDDLPLNVSRETLQQNKLLKVIKKKLIRKTLDMIKKLSDKDFEAFYKEYSTSLKLGVMEDQSNRTRLAKLLRFYSSNSDDKQTSLTDYVSRMKLKQDAIYFIAGSSKDEVKKSPFVEKLLKRGYEVLYLIEPVDEYVMQNLPEFEGKKFQNAAKEGLQLDKSDKAKERKEALAKEYEPLLKWMKEDGLKDMIERAEISERLSTTPAALVANTYGWSGNYERIMRAQAYQKAQDASQNFYMGQKKIFEINPRHPVIKELKRKVETQKSDPTTKELALVLFDTASLRSGFALRETVPFAERIEKILRSSLNIPQDEKVEEDEEPVEQEEAVPDPKPDKSTEDKADSSEPSKDEL